MNEYEKVLRLIRHKELTAKDICNMSAIITKDNLSATLEAIELYQKANDDYLNAVINFYGSK